MLYTLIIVFGCSVTLSGFLTRYVRNLALSKGWVDEPNSGRHIHRSPVPRLGGVAIFLAIVVVTGIALYARQVLELSAVPPVKASLAILCPATLVFIMGIYDDLKNLQPRIKFSVEIVAGSWLYLEGFRIRFVEIVFGTNELKGILEFSLTILWILLITNAFNLIDGLDGLAAGSAVFSTLTLLFVSQSDGNLLIGFFAVALAGAIIGFLRYNFNPATIFLGDSGSLFIGFSLSALALQGSQKAPTMVSVVVPVICFGFPILDVALAVMRRFLSGKPLFQGDGDHIHHRLLKRGLTQRGAVFILYGVSGVLALLSLASLRGRSVTTLVLVAVAVGICLGIQQLKFHEVDELFQTFNRTMRQKQVIKNNLVVRHAVESLRACVGLSEIESVLIETLRSIGFDGFTLYLPDGAAFQQMRSLETRESPVGKLSSSWGNGKSLRGDWEVSWKVMDEQGCPCGSFSAFKQLNDEPLLMDVSLLTNGFSMALAGAVRRSTSETTVVTREEVLRGSGYTGDDTGRQNRVTNFRFVPSREQMPETCVGSINPKPDLSAIESNGEF